MAPGVRNTNEFTFKIEISRNCQKSTCDIEVWYNRGASYPFQKFEYKMVVQKRSYLQQCETHLALGLISSIKL